MAELYQHGSAPLETLQKLQANLNLCPPEVTKLNLRGRHITSLTGVIFPPGLRELHLSENQITSLEGVQFHPALRELYLSYNRITTLQGAQFPVGLTVLELGYNSIASLQGVHFPHELKKLYLLNNQIASLDGVQFPSTLEYLYLANNRITTLQGVQFPRGLSHFNFQDNPLISLAGMINPNTNIKNYFMNYYNSLYLRDIDGEKSSLKAARQSQKATLKEMSDLSQHSMQNQLKAVTSFLREGMEARARQHEEQVKKDNEERGKPIFFVRGPTGKIYHVPLNTTMSIQAVLDYLNSHYYISALEDCGVMHLIFSGQRLEPERTLADYNVQAESTLNLVCKFRPNRFQGGSKKRRHKKSKKHYKIRRNKSIKK